MPGRTFTFDGYTVRPVHEKDRELLNNWIATDPYHQGRMTADFFLKLLPGQEACAMEDETGHVVLYFKTTTAIRIAIQFQPTRTYQERSCNGRALVRGLRWLEDIFRRNFFHEILTDTEAPELRHFVKRHLGFVEMPVMSLTVDSPREAPRKPPERVESLSNVGQGRVG